jgi:hypothetical protein
VDDDVGVERCDEVDDAVVVARRCEVERGSLQASTRGIGVDAEEFADPRLLLEELGDTRSEVASHAADEHAPSCH